VVAFASVKIPGNLRTSMAYDPAQEHTEYLKRQDYCRTYYQEHREERLAYQSEYQKEYRRNNWERRLLRKAKERANKHNIPFDITVKDVVIPTHCPVLGIPLFFTERKATDNTPSLDRIVPALGYIKGNIAVISHRANRLKQDSTVEDVLKLLAWLQRVTT
jgi:hypothetical protein